MKKLFITILFFLIFPFSAVAWPEKPIKIIAPFSAGNGSDVAARYFAEKLEEKLKVRVYIENKPGGGGKIGINDVKNSIPDGYTFLYSPSFFSFIQHTQIDANYTTNDFIPISLIVNHRFFVAGKNDVSELDFVKIKNEILYCSVGYGSPTHLTTLLFLKKYNLKGIEVPYKSSTEALLDLKQKRIDLCAMPEALLFQYKQENFISIYDSVFFNNWNALFAPKNTPKNIIDKLSTAINEIKKDQGFIEFNKKIKIEVANQDDQISFYKYIIDFDFNVKNLIEEIGLIKK